MALTRFYLDENLSHRIATTAERLGVDIVSTHGSGSTGMSDRAQLLLAARDGRCVVTRDYDDFGPLTAEFYARGLPHAGVLLISPSLARQGPYAIAEALARYAHEHPDGLPSYMVDWLGPLPRS